MAQDRPRVTFVELIHGQKGLEVTVKIIRPNSNTKVTHLSEPPASELPKDVREAIRNWLDYK